MSKKILFLVEGAKTEVKMIENLAQNILNLANEPYEIKSYSGCIYELYDELFKDEDIDLFSLLVEKNIISDKELFGKEIHLVYDFEPHYQKYSDEKIKKLLEFFDNETENGKLHINYPLVESSFDITNFANCHTEFIDVDLKGFNGSIYKKDVKKRTCFKTKNNINFNLSDTKHQKMTLIMNFFRFCNINNITDIPSYLCYLRTNSLSHNDILYNQLNHKNDNNRLYVISMLSLILIDFDLDKFIDIINNYLIEISK